MTVVWVVGQIKGDDWELGGAFSTEEKAREVCTEPDDGYWPVEVDKFLGRETDLVAATFPHG